MTTLKKYQKQKFKEFQKIDETPIKDNEAYITLSVSSFTELISKFSTKTSPILNKEFLDIIYTKAKYIPLEHPITLCIESNALTSDEKIIVRKLIKAHFTLKKIKKQTELVAIKRKSFFFLVLGLIFFFLFLILLRLSNLVAITEISSFIASFSIWEFAEIVIFETDDTKEIIAKESQLSEMRIVFDT